MSNLYLGRGRRDFLVALCCFPGAVQEFYSNLCILGEPEEV